MNPVVTIIGPSDPGPGVRQLMLEAAQQALAAREIDDVTRVDVPGKGSGEDVDDAGVRNPVAVAIPALQSGSLFGDRSALLLVDADQLLKAEATVLAEIVASLTPDSPVAAVIVSSGAIPAPLGSALAKTAERVGIDKMDERKAGTWLAAEARERHLKIPGAAAAALIQRFGSDVGALGQALDQLASSGEPITAEGVMERFRNRPDEPMWHFSDAVASGDSGEALRRLADLLQHGHPLQVTAFLQTNLRRRCLAAAAPDYETFVERDGGRPNYAMKKVWDQRHRTRADYLHRSLNAIARADIHLKTTPEATHRVTMERLTVALCLWSGGRRR